MSNWERYKQTMRAAPTIWSGARANDIPALIRLVRMGDVNARDVREYSPLMLAAYSGSLEAAILLLQVGADPNTCDSSGNSALMGAAYKGDVAMIEVLLKNGASPEQRNNSGMTALDFAVMFGRAAAIEKLKAVQPESKSNGRFTVLVKILKSCLYRMPY